MPHCLQGVFLYVHVGFTVFAPYLLLSFYIFARYLPRANLRKSIQFCPGYPRLITPHYPIFVVTSSYNCSLI